MQFAVWQWLVGGLAALLVGMSKTGVPGVGILTVTLLAQAYGGWNSVGLMLPMLLFGDLFAVAWYRRHAHWGVLVRLLPWVVVGLVLGAVVLHYLGQNAKTKALMNPLIGGLVLLMLGMHFLQGKLGERFAPRSKMGTAGTGVVAGLATTISNAAGPIMTIFLTAQQFAKEQFMGTIAWYFFIINASKVPISFRSRCSPEMLSCWISSSPPPSSSAPSWAAGCSRASRRKSSTPSSLSWPPWAP